MGKDSRPMACTRFVRRHMRRLREDSSGAAIVEFVLIAPAALALLGIICVLGQGMEILGKASLTARTVTTLVTTQGATISQANLNCILNAAGAVMSPWGTSQLSVVVSEVYVTSSTTGKIIWSSATLSRLPTPCRRQCHPGLGRLRYRDLSRLSARFPTYTRRWDSRTTVSSATRCPNPSS